MKFYHRIVQTREINCDPYQKLYWNRSTYCYLRPIIFFTTQVDALILGTIVHLWSQTGQAKWPIHNTTCDRVKTTKGGQCCHQLASFWSTHYHHKVAPRAVQRNKNVSLTTPLLRFPLYCQFCFTLIYIYSVFSLIN